jgi:hypothetical protein
MMMKMERRKEEDQESKQAREWFADVSEMWDGRKEEQGAHQAFSKHRFFSSKN